MKKLIPLLILILSILVVACGEGEGPKVPEQNKYFTVNSVKYESLQEAVNAAVAKTKSVSVSSKAVSYTVIQMTNNVSGIGAEIPESYNGNLEFDFGSYTYTIKSSSTEQAKGLIIKNNGDVSISSGKIGTSGLSSGFTAVKVCGSSSSLTLDGSASISVSNSINALELREGATATVNSDNATVSGALKLEENTKLSVEKGTLEIKSISVVDSSGSQSQSQSTNILKLSDNSVVKASNDVYEEVVQAIDEANSTLDTNNILPYAETTPNKGAITGKVSYYNTTDSSGIIVSIEKTDGLVSKSVKSLNESIDSVETKGISTTPSASKSLSGYYTTNNNGRYSFEDLEPGTYTIYASSNSTVEKAIQTNVSVAAGKSVNAEDLQLTATGNLSGKVTIDGKSTGNAGIIVFISSSSYIAITDDSGNYTISNIPVGSNYQLVLMKGDYLKVLTTVGILAGTTKQVDASDISSSEIKSGARVIVWKGSFANQNVASLQNPEKLWAYYNTTDGCSYIYDGSQWTLLASKGGTGAQGATGAAGSSGADGKSIIWKGSLTSAPSNPQELWAYYNSTDGNSYIYNGSSWDILASSGKSITWKGESSSAPSSPQLYWAYYNTTDGCSYIYDGSQWTLLAKNGNVGATGENGHNLVYIPKVEATCNVAGSTACVKDCTTDSYVIEPETIEALGHTYENVVVPPTCVSDGYTKHTCSVCDHVEIDTPVNSLGHTEVVINTVAPTCTTSGHTVFKCSVCNHSWSGNTVNALGHNEVADEEVAPDCTTDGKTAGSHCSRCLKVLVAQNAIPALGHNFDNGCCTKCSHCLSVGDHGKSGGWIFYDCDADNVGDQAGSDGLKSSECGWRFLEVAPFCLGDYSSKVPNFNSYVSGNENCSTSIEIGSGKDNTIQISEFFDENLGIEDSNNRFYQALYCNENGTEGWYIPSLNELLALNEFAQNIDLGVFNEIGTVGGVHVNTGKFLSSSEKDSGSWYLVEFSDGSVSSALHFTKYNISFTWNACLLIRMVDSSGNLSTSCGSHVSDENWTVIKEATCMEEGLKKSHCKFCHEEIKKTIPRTNHSDLTPELRQITYCDTCQKAIFGPAGGYIFYDCDADNDSSNNGAGPDGFKSSICGWRYLEASPKVIALKTWLPNYDARYQLIDKGNFNNYEIWLDTDIGAGFENTLTVRTVCNTNGFEGTAACAAYDFSYNDYSDWFLPSVFELRELLTGSYSTKYSDTTYWTSSKEYSYVYFYKKYSESSYEVASNAYVDSTYSVIPVRYVRTTDCANMELEVQRTQATCTLVGKDVYSYSDGLFSINFDAYFRPLGHDFSETTETTIKEVTCDEYGYKKVVTRCTRCNADKAEYHPVLPTGHSYTEKSGEITYCDNCHKAIIGPAGGWIGYDCDADNSNVNNGAGQDGLKSAECGWRYIEIAPNNLRTAPDGTPTIDASSLEYMSGIQSFAFGYYITETGVLASVTPNSNTIGSGWKNTKTLYETRGNNVYSSTKKTSGYTSNSLEGLDAISQCWNLVYKGFDDWFLPNMKEIEVCSKTSYVTKFSAILDNGCVYLSSYDESSPFESNVCYIDFYNYAWEKGYGRSGKNGVDWINLVRPMRYINVDSDGNIIATDFSKLEQ